MVNGVKWLRILSGAQGLTNTEVNPLRLNREILMHSQKRSYKCFNLIIFRTLHQNSLAIELRE